MRKRVQNVSLFGAPCGVEESLGEKEADNTVRMNEERYRAMIPRFFVLIWQHWF